MSELYSLHPLGSQLLVCMLFIASVLLVWSIMSRWNLIRCRFCIIGDIALLTTDLLTVWQAAGYNNSDCPVAPVSCLTVITLLYATGGILYSHVVKAGTLSPSSINEATDDLPTGLCFTDPEGRIVLCNHIMSELTAACLDHSARSKSEIDRILAAADDEGIVDIYPAAGSNIHSHLWKFREYPLTSPGVEGYTQITAYDVTELREGISLLNSENKEMKIVNKVLSRMYDRLADRVRERETLDLKMRIHNNIGTSLIRIGELIDDKGSDVTEESREDIARQLDILKDAVDYLVDDFREGFLTLGDMQSKARSMGGELVIIGEFPADESADRLLASAAGECMTNCIRHAGGNRVTLRITEDEHLIRGELTNNGIPPQEPVVEGGGLTSLRRKVESEGGSLLIHTEPVFKMELTLPKQRNRK